MWVRLGACHWSRRTSPQPFAPRGKGRFARVRGARQSADWLRPRPLRDPAAAFRRLAARRLHLPCRPAVMRILCVIILHDWFLPPRMKFLRAMVAQMPCDCRTPVTQGATCACARASTAGNRTRLSATHATHATRHSPSPRAIARTSPTAADRLRWRRGAV